MTTPRLGAPELTQGQAVPESTVNEANRYIEQGAHHFVVKDRDLATPPGSPADGDCYLVAASGTGAWSGQDGKVAFYASGWLFVTVLEGMTFWVSDEDKLLAYTGAAYNEINASGTSLTAASTSETRTGTSTTKAVTPGGLFGAAQFVTLTDGAAITPDLATGVNFTVTLGGNRTLANPSNSKQQSGVIEVKQDATGSRTLAYGSNWKFPGGAPTLSTAANAIDLISYIVKADGTILCTISKAFS